MQDPHEWPFANLFYYIKQIGQREEPRGIRDDLACLRKLFSAKLYSRVIARAGVCMWKQAVGLAGCALVTFAAGVIGAIASVEAASFYAQLVRPAWAPPAPGLVTFASALNFAVWQLHPQTLG